MRFKAALMAVFMVLVLPVLALTTDEYYERATNKYLLGDFSGAAADLDEVLKIDPSYQKAVDLQKEVVRELGKNQPAAETTATTLAPVTPLIAPPPLKKFVPRVTVDEAHRLFLEGQRYYGEGDYLQARKYFQQVLELLPGHEESTGYFKKIIFEAGVSAVSQVSAEALAKEKKVESTKRYEFYFAMVSTLIALLLGLILLLALFFFTRLMYFWWRSISTYCDECGTRNSNDSEFCKKCGNRLKFTELTNEEKEWFSRFNWIKNPFTLNVIPETYAGHQVEVSIVIEKLNKLSGHILVIGGLGTGKTTLLQWLEKYFKDKFETIYIMRPASRPDELIDLVSATLTKRTTHTHKYSLYEFQELCKRYKRNIMLLLDEAHEFNEEFEQFLRTLGDLPNVYLVMAGLPQAREKLKRDLPALFDRIVESVLLGALSFDETKEMIQKRITNAGGTGLGPFTLPAVKKIYEQSFGIPRGILKICDWVISRAVVSKKSTIDVTDIAAYEVETRSAKLPEIEISGEEVPKNE